MNTPEISGNHSILEEAIRVEMARTGEAAEQIVKRMNMISKKHRDTGQERMHDRILRHIQAEDQQKTRNVKDSTS